MLAVRMCCARHCELPLSKMGNKGLFPGVAVPRAFFGTFFRFERKYYPPRGGSPNVRAGVGASIPQMGFFTARSAYTAACRGFPLASIPFGSPSEDGERPVERQYSTRAGVGASIPRRDFPTAEGFACDKIGAALPAVNSVCRSPSAWNLRRNSHLLVTAPVCIGCIETSKKWKNMQAGERKKHGYTPALPLKNSKRPCSFWLHGRLC